MCTENMNDYNITKFLVAFFIFNGVGGVLGKDQFGMGSSHAGFSDSGHASRGWQDQFVAAAQMPEQSQKALLGLMGAGLVASGQLPCNLFGGRDACIPLPSDSTYSLTCSSGANTVVDCAFNAEVKEAMARDPSTELTKEVAKEGYVPCDSCVDALHAFWCGQTVPTCGTFGEVVDEILPVIRQVASGSAPPLSALQTALPRMLQALSLGLPCREMCEAISASCNCGRVTTFGQVMKALESKRKGTHTPRLTNLSSTTAHTLFTNVWATPVCDLFSPRTMPGFVGVCHIPPSLKSCDWCGSGRKRPINLESQIVAQLVEAVGGMMQAGVEKILSLASSGREQGQHQQHQDQQQQQQQQQHQDQQQEQQQAKKWMWGEEASAPPLPKKSGGGGMGWWWLVSIFVVLVLGGVVGGGWYYKTQRQAPWQYMDMNAILYTPPANDRGDS